MSAWPKAAFDDGNERMKTAARCAMKNRSVENVEQTAKARSCHVPADGNSIVIGVFDSKGTSVVTGHRYDHVIFKLVSQVHSLYGIVGTALSCLGITLQAWCCEVCATGLTQALAGASLSTGERVGHRLDPGSFVRGMILLSDHLWFCAEAKLTRARDKEQQQQQQQQRQQRQRQEQRQRQRQHEPSWPALLASMGEPSPAAQAHRLLSASPSPTLPPSPGGGGGGKGGRGTDNGGKPPLPGNSARPAWRLETCYPQGASSGQCFTVESADAVCARNWSRGAAARGDQRQQTWGPPQPTPLWNLSDFYLSFCNSYTLWELFSGLSSPNTLNCSLDVVLKEGGEMTTCRQCVEAYQDYDHHAQEKYEEFESVLHKYLQSEEYSVKSCPEDCKVAPVVFRSGPPFTHSAVLSAFINCGGRGSRVKGGLGVWTGAGGRGPRVEVVSRRNKRTLDILKYGIERTGERSLWRETRLKRPVLMTLIGFNALEGTIGGDICTFKKTAYLMNPAANLGKEKDVAGKYMFMLLLIPPRLEPPLGRVLLSISPQRVGPVTEGLPSCNHSGDLPSSSGSGRPSAFPSSSSLRILTSHRHAQPPDLAACVKVWTVSPASSDLE
ncbi:hypothetical protein JEQ12_002313 [Ovis aries]|uniref:Transmembrane protein FAM155A n=1 Tax=Ovis aries TaxID=9940 RepID=A0A836A0N3_SHEEP|nr:hypothetical protein JEQ12_002313 [Ovis aries]